LNQAVSDAEDAEKQARERHNELQQKWHTAKDYIVFLKKRIEAHQPELRGLETEFSAALAPLRFSNEEQFLAARLGGERRAELSARAKALEDRQTDLTVRQRDRENRLATEMARKVTDKSLEEFKSQFKKYRNFAQGLTFEMMMGYANRQLQKMTDRYLLIRDDAQPLELNVVDNYQAGEIRSTKNLSGGESFIVSLSLALGLSHMASRNVRVDSLFLDEGFGTLDEEALDTALETLAGLQQDGKMIGVISHVSALKERIATQIQVNPLSGGKSLLSGPGCSQKQNSQDF